MDTEFKDKENPWIKFSELEVGDFFQMEHYLTDDNRGGPIFMKISMVEKYSDTYATITAIIGCLPNSIMLGSNSTSTEDSDSLVRKVEIHKIIVERV